MTSRPSPEQLLARAPHEYNPGGGLVRTMKHLPQNLCIALLKLYRTIVSPMYGDVCRYFPSCSAYALEAFTVHGAVRGLGLSVRRLLRCHPWAAGGIDRVPSGGREFPSVASTPKIVLLNHPTLVRDHVHDCPARDDHAAQGANAR